MSHDKPQKKLPPEKHNKENRERIKFSEKKHVRVFYDGSQTYGNDDKKWNTICLPGLGFSLLGLGVALIIVGIVNNIEDLIIIGSLFSFGSLAFFAMWYAIVCRPMCQRNVVQTFDALENRKHERPLSEYSAKIEYSEQDYYNSGFDPNEDLIPSKNRPQPSENQLYGERMRSFLATPATTSDVLFNENQGTPPPPRVALPSEPGDKKNSVYTMDINEALEGKRKEISDIELI